MLAIVGCTRRRGLGLLPGALHAVFLMNSVVNFQGATGRSGRVLSGADALQGDLVLALCNTFNPCTLGIAEGLLIAERNRSSLFYWGRIDIMLDPGRPVPNR